MTKYERLSQRLAKAASRGKQKSRADAIKRERASIELLRSAGFEDFIPEAGMYFDGRRVAHVVRTVNYSGAWVVSAWINSIASSKAELAAFGR